jgi:phosphate transport system protein
MQEQHIVTAFDRDLEAIQSNIMKMGGLVEAAMTGSATALDDRDVDLAEQVRADDKKIDALEVLINEDCARLIALRAPMASDLRTVLSVMKIAGALERVGDYAKNLAKRSVLLLGSTRIDGAEGSLLRMIKEVESMLGDVLNAYVAGDSDLAETVRLRDHTVDQMYNGLFREILTHMMEDPRNISTCMHLHFIAKNVERMGDHVTNIAEQVIYAVDGELPEDPRPKGNIAVADGQ